MLVITLLLGVIGVTLLVYLLSTDVCFLGSQTEFISNPAVSLRFRKDVV
mgnify:CR=1 FL=1